MDMYMSRWWHPKRVGPGVMGYEVVWDHITVARYQYGKLADDWFALRGEVTELNAKLGNREAAIERKDAALDYYRNRNKELLLERGKMRATIDALSKPVEAHPTEYTVYLALDEVQTERLKEAEAASEYMYAVHSHMEEL